jgi:hypothetical protein
MLDFQGAPGEPDTDDEVRRRAMALAEFIRTSGRLGDFGLTRPDKEQGIEQAKVVSLRSSRRIGQDGQVAFDVIAQVLQKRMVPVSGRTLPFYGGSTIVIGPGGEVRYLVAKSVDSQRRLERMLSFAASEAGGQLWSSYLSNATPPFKLLHNRK